MIKLPFSVAVALYILVVLGIIFACWIYAEIKRRRQVSSDKKILWECPICARVYWLDSDREISQCPHCQSFNKKGDKAGINRPQTTDNSPQSIVYSGKAKKADNR